MHRGHFRRLRTKIHQKVKNWKAQHTVQTECVSLWGRKITKKLAILCALQGL